MSRSVKDLRELICISRLSVRSSDSDEEWDHSGDDSSVSSGQQPQSGAASYRQLISKSPNEALASPTAIAVANLSKEQKLESCRSQRDARCIQNKEIVVGRPGSAVGGVRRPPSALDRLSKPSLPKRNLDSSSSNDSNRKDPHKTVDFRRRSGQEKILKSKKVVGNMLQYIDATVISNLIEKCNVQLKEMGTWLRTGQNFVSLANFLMTSFHYTKRKELFEMEMSFILNELEVAFGVGIRDKTVKIDHLSELLHVILREYPSKILGRNGLQWFVRIIEIFCNGKDESFRQLLSEVTFSTQNKQHIQWLLGMRAFGLISLANGVLYFYKSLCVLDEKKKQSAHVEACGTTSELKEHWLEATLEHDYLEVFEYLLQHLDKNQALVDKVIFSSAIYGSERILAMFLKQSSEGINLDKISSTGSTALHISVNNEKAKIIQILLENGASVNTVNSEVDDATALHMAVITGNENIVSLLIAHGADKSAQMRDSSPITPAELARELGHHSLIKYIS